jgi:hypothetical protein
MPAVKFFACLDFERKSSFCKRLLFLKNFLPGPAPASSLTLLDQRKLWVGFLFLRSECSVVLRRNEQYLTG